MNLRNYIPLYILVISMNLHAIPDPVSALKAYDSTRTSTRHGNGPAGQGDERDLHAPEWKYINSLALLPFAPVAHLVCIGFDVQSNRRARAIERGIESGETTEPQDNPRYQRTRHLMAIVRKKDRTVLSNFLTDPLYKRRLNMETGGRTPVTFAAYEGWTEGLQIMIDSGGDSNPELADGSDYRTLVTQLIRDVNMPSLGVILAQRKTLSQGELSAPLMKKSGTVFKTIAEHVPGYTYDEEYCSLNIQKGNE